MNVSDDYFEITRIPEGSRQILIEEIHPSKNYLCIGRANTNQTFLNGDRLILMPGEFAIDKILGLYERENEQEKIKIPGPIPFEMTVQVCWTRGKRIPKCKCLNVFLILIRCWCEAKVRIPVFDMNIRCQRMKPKNRFIIGNWAIGRLVLRPAAVAFRNVSQSVLKASKELSMKSSAGQVLKMMNQTRKHALATMYLAQHIGGLVLGNFVQLLVDGMVSFASIPTNKIAYIDALLLLNERM